MEFLVVLAVLGGVALWQRKRLAGLIRKDTESIRVDLTAGNGPDIPIRPAGPDVGTGHRPPGGPQPTIPAPPVSPPPPTGATPPVAAGGSTAPATGSRERMWVNGVEVVPTFGAGGGRMAQLLDPVKNNDVIEVEIETLAVTDEQARYAEGKMAWGGAGTGLGNGEVNLILKKEGDLPPGVDRSGSEWVDLSTSMADYTPEDFWRIQTQGTEALSAFFKPWESLVGQMQTRVRTNPSQKDYPCSVYVTYTCADLTRQPRYLYAIVPVEK